MLHICEICVHLTGCEEKKRELKTIYHNFHAGQNCLRGTIFTPLHFISIFSSNLMGKTKKALASV